MSDGARRAARNGRVTPAQDGNAFLSAWRDVVGPAAARMREAIPGDRGVELIGRAHLPARRELRRFQRRLPMRALTATTDLAARLRTLTGRDLIDLESIQDLITAGMRAAMVRNAHRANDYTIDDFGFDEQWAEIWMPIARLIYRRYWRVAAEGLENVPRRGGALLVSNHAGVFPWDGAMIKVAVHENVYSRHVRALVADWMFATPGLSWFIRRSGQTIGNPDDTQRLLSAGQLVLVFPEGIRGTGKPFSERYRLRRFGRGGFVDAAVRAGVPIIPVSVMGSEETYPMLGNIAPLARVMGAPYFPVTPTLPLLGPLGLIPLPSKWRIRFHEPVNTDGLDAATLDRGTALEISDGVRSVIQDGLIEMLGERRTVFRG